jgi:hypothetical protein
MALVRQFGVEAAIEALAIAVEDQAGRKDEWTESEQWRVWKMQEASAGVGYNAMPSAPSNPHLRLAA